MIFSDEIPPQRGLRYNLDFMGAGQIFVCGFPGSWDYYIKTYKKVYFPGTGGFDGNCINLRTGTGHRFFISMYQTVNIKCKILQETPRNYYFNDIVPGQVFRAYNGGPLLMKTHDLIETHVGYLNNGVCINLEEEGKGFTCAIGRNYSIVDIEGKEV